MSATDTSVMPDYAPVPQSALGPALDERGYYVGRVERNLYWITDGTYQCAFLTTSDGVVMLDAPPTIGNNIQRAVDEIAAANGVSNKVNYLVYSHHHSDHVGASSLFDRNVTRIGHEETRKLLLRDDDRARPPNEETFQDTRTLDIGEIGECPTADERMERDARRVEDPNEVLIRLAEPLSGKRQPAARECSESKHRVCPQRDEQRLRLGDQALGGLVFTLLRTCDRLGEPCGHQVPQRAGLLRDSRTFGRTRDRVAHGSAMKVGPCLEHERAGEQAQPPLRPCGGGSRAGGMEVPDSRPRRTTLRCRHRRAAPDRTSRQGTWVRFARRPVCPCRADRSTPGLASGRGRRPGA
jgi:Metallo-beta-lactamase superfamily